MNVLQAMLRPGELRRRVLLTLCVIAAYRAGTYVPLPGIDAAALARSLHGAPGGLVGMAEMLSGGAVGRMAVFALGVMPYVTASILVQVATLAVPSLAALRKEGEEGRERLKRYTWALAVAVAAFQAWGLAAGLMSAEGVVAHPGIGFLATSVAILTAGSALLTWLGERVTKKGLGNGISLVIFAGIVAGLPSAVAATVDLALQGALPWALVLALPPVVAGLVAAVVLVERAQRRIPVGYPGRAGGTRPPYLPLKVNAAGVMPAIFASAALTLPTGLSALLPSGAGSWAVALAPGHAGHMLATAALVALFAFLYVAATAGPRETAENLVKAGGFVPGMRPGEQTEAYLDRVITRVSVIGAAYLVVVCTLPEVAASAAAVPFALGGTGLLVVVGTSLEVFAQARSHALEHGYGGLVAGRAAPRPVAA